MSDLISREALLLALCESCGKAGMCRIPCVDYDLIVQAPAVDTVKVVRCKDCEYSKLLRDTNFKNEYPWRYYHEDCRLCICNLLIEDEPLRVEDDCYCAYGERRKGDENAAD